jgi:hypothetical protein
MCNLIVGGTISTFGVFMNDFAKDFAVGRGVIAWAGSLLSGVSISTTRILERL